METVKALVENRGTDINLPLCQSGATPLFVAAANGNTTIVKKLLSCREIRLNDRTIDGTTALYMAAQNGHVDVVTALLERGDLDLDGGYHDETPLAAASRNRHHNVVAALRKAIAARDPNNPNTADQEGKTVLMRAIERQAGNVASLMQHPLFEPNLADAQGRTALYYAAKANNNDTVRTLLARGDIDCNTQTTQGATPLYVATQNGHFHTVNALLAHRNINVNLPLTASGATPLYQAASKGYLGIVKSLLAHRDIDCNQATAAGASPLYVAAAGGQEEIVRLLLEREELNFETRYAGNTAITAASTRGIERMLRNARSAAAVLDGRTIPFDGKTVDVAGLTDDALAKAAVAAWPASGMTHVDLQRLRSDFDAYAKTGTMAADTFNTRYAAFFTEGFKIEDADLRRNFTRLWKHLPVA